MDNFEYIWPLPALDNRLPKVSDGYHMRQSGIFHAGADIMYAAITNDPVYIPGPIGLNYSGYYKKGIRYRTKGHYLPPNTPAIACVGGKIFKANLSSKGYQLVLGKIGGSLAFYYQHLQKLNVETGETVELGQSLGIVGGNPNEVGAIAHLHFEIWRGGPSNHVNPSLFLNKWKVMDLDGRFL